MYVQYVPLDLEYRHQIGLWLFVPWGQPVNDILLSRMGMTFFIAFLAFIVCWGLAIPVGIFVAVKQYSFADYFFTFLGFIGLATPGFLLALVLMYICYAEAGHTGGRVVFTRICATADELGKVSWIC